MTRIYLAGPMAGYPDLNRQAFRDTAWTLHLAGHQVVNPHNEMPDDHDGDCPRSYAVNDGHSAACYLRACLKVMLDCDEVHLLPGWESSVGARLELQVAAACGLKVTFAGDVGGVR